MTRFAIALLICTTLLASAVAQPAAEQLKGHWTGALIVKGTPIGLNLKISESDGGLLATPEIPEWLWYTFDPASVTITHDGVIVEDLYSGDAVLSFDPAFHQLVGTIGVGEEAIRVHLKPVPSPPAPQYTVEPVSFASADGTQIRGVLTVPSYGEPAPAILLLHGRGCNRRSAGEARFYAERGMAALTFDKRGSGESEGDCSAATHEMTVDDAEAALRLLQRDKRVDRKRIGYRGISAGAWTAQALAERALAQRRLADPAFLVTWIGPATSIRQQQLSSAATYGEEAGLSPEAVALTQEAVRLLTSDDREAPETLGRLLQIRQQAEEEGWLGTMFAPDDLPTGASDLTSTFLSKFRFDPGPVLKKLAGTPYLAVFGVDDTIVPMGENITALTTAFGSESGLRIVELAGRGHSLEHGDQVVTLPNGSTYFKTDTVEPAYMSETVRFLREQDLMPR